MSGGWNNGPVKDPWTRINEFCDFMREFFIVVLVVLIAAAIVDWIWL